MIWFLVIKVSSLCENLLSFALIVRTFFPPHVRYPSITTTTTKDFFFNPDGFGQYLWGEDEVQTSGFFNTLDNCNVQPGLKATGLISWEKRMHSKASHGPDEGRLQVGGGRCWGGKRPIFGDVSEPPARTEEVLSHVVVMSFFLGSVC